MTLSAIYSTKHYSLELIQGEMDDKESLTVANVFNIQ